MKDQASLLHKLVLSAEAVLALRSPGDPDAVVQLLDDVALEVKRPADGERVMHDYTTMLASAVMMAAIAMRHRGAEVAPVYFRIVGVILPDVRADFGKAIEIRKRGPTP